MDQVLWLYCLTYHQIHMKMYAYFTTEMVLIENCVDARRFYLKMQRLAEQEWATSGTTQSISVMKALSQAEYSDNAAYCETSIANLVTRGERSGMKCIEQIFQLHRKGLRTLSPGRPQLQDQIRSVNSR